MTQPFEPGPGFEKSKFMKHCVYCGAWLEVAVARLAGSNEPEDYACPECGKLYEVRAAMQPSVHLVARRTDGKDDRYQETMF